MRQQQQRQRLANVRRAGAESGEAVRAIADYYLYPLAEQTTVSHNQTKQVSFLDVKGASARKAYEHRAYWFESSDTAMAADVAVQFSNSTRQGLGRQLPAGIVRVYMRDAAGEPKFVGENRIDHTPQGSDISIKIGEAFDVTVQPTVESVEKVSKWRTRYTMSYVVRNARAQPVTVTVRQGGLGRDGKVVKESLPSDRVDAYNLAWDVQTPANGETELTFTVETGW
jgi:hypothetical protein